MKLIKLYGFLFKEKTREILLIYIIKKAAYMPFVYFELLTLCLIKLRKRA